MNTKTNIYPFSEANKNYSCSATNNPSSYKCLAILSMLYICLMLFNSILTNRYIGSELIFVLGGTFTSPFVFLLDNIIAEIYGFNITRSIILSALATQSLFVLLCQLAIHAPYPHFLYNQQAYELLLGMPLVRIHLSTSLAYLLAILLNTKILTQWKVLLHGKKFWFRSLCTCTLSELFYSVIAIILMELQAIPVSYILRVMVISYLIKCSYNIIFLIPAQLVVSYIRQCTGIDVYDFDVLFTPSRYFKLRR